jgi:hypothetical protein
MQDAEFSFSPSEWSHNSFKSNLSFYKTPSSSMSGSFSSSKPSTVNYLSFSSSPTKKKHPTVSEIFQGAQNNHKSSDVDPGHFAKFSNDQDNYKKILREIRSKSIVIESSKYEYYQGNLSSFQLLERSKISTLAIKLECDKLRDYIRCRFKESMKFTLKIPTFSELKSINIDVSNSYFVINLTNFIAIVIPEFGIFDMMQ